MLEVPETKSKIKKEEEKLSDNQQVNILHQKQQLNHNCTGESIIEFSIGPLLAKLSYFLPAVVGR